jgi:hypothetical protein
MPVTLPPASKAIRQALYQALNVQAITSLLANGSASIFYSTASADTLAQPSAYPMLVFYKQSGVATHAAFGTPVADTQLWTVKGIVRGGKSSFAEDIDYAARQILDHGELAIVGGRNLDLRRASDLDYTELDGDTQYRHHGGIYRVVVAG